MRIAGIHMLKRPVQVITGERASPPARAISTDHVNNPNIKPVPTIKNLDGAYVFHLHGFLS
jgi:hypothetical protein